MSENGNKIKTEKKGRREARERRPPRNYIRCDLLPETPFSAELPPPALRALRRFQRLNFRLEKNEDSSSVASAAGDAASWECGTAHHCPTPQGPCRGHGSHRPSLALLMHSAWRARGRARSKVADSTWLWAGPGDGSLPTCRACRAPGISADTELGACCRALDPASRFLVWGTSWQFCILEAKAQTVLKWCLGHQP